MKRLSSFGFVTVPQSSPDSQHASTGKRMICSAVTETSVEPGQVEQEPAGLSSTSSMVLPPDCGKAWLYTARVDCATARCALRHQGRRALFDLCACAIDLPANARLLPVGAKVRVI